MRMNIKKEQLMNQLIDLIKVRYPEIEILNIEPSAEDPDDIWIHVNADMDEEREFEMCHYAAELETDILVDYGYSFSFITHNPNVEYA